MGKADHAAVPAAQNRLVAPAEIASRAISGFTEDGHFIAFVDAAGNIEAASDGIFGAWHPSERWPPLCRCGNRERPHRQAPGSGRSSSYPAGLARLTDTRHLLVVIDEDQLTTKAVSGPSAGIGAAADTALVTEAVQYNGRHQHPTRTRRGPTPGVVKDIASATTRCWLDRAEMGAAAATGRQPAYAGAA